MSEVRTVWYEDSRHLPGHNIVALADDTQMPAACVRGVHVSRRIAFASPDESLGPANDHSDFEWKLIHLLENMPPTSPDGNRPESWPLFAYVGWNARAADSDLTQDTDDVDDIEWWHAGWLAHAIAHHDEEQALVIENDAPEAPESVAPRYCYSRDGEGFHGTFATRAEALSHALGDADGSTRVYTGIAQPFTANELATAAFDHEMAIDAIDYHINESIHSEDYYETEVTDEQREDLQASVEAAIVAWMERNQIAPTVYRDVVEVKEHVIDETAKERGS